MSTGAVTHARDPALDTPVRASLPDCWPPGDDRPQVYVTFGSVAAATGLVPTFYIRVVEQLADVPARVLLTVGNAGDPADLGPLPSHVHVECWWPQRDVMPSAGVVVGHGGFGTTQAAFAAAVPQIVLPLFSFDQFLNAERVAAVGVGHALVDEAAMERRAGELVPAGPQATDRLADAVVAVLAETTFTGAASALAAEMGGLPDVDACVATLDALQG